MKRSSAALYLAFLIGAVAVVVLALPKGPPGPAPVVKAPVSAPADEPTATSPLPLPPYSQTQFLNIGPDARFTGSAACAGCHPNNFKSYALTAHSNALSDVNPAEEPPDGTFEHKPSGRTYRVYRKDGVLRHEERLRTPEGLEIVHTDLPVRFRVGSGHFTRSYFVEIEGFLHESPITWYASKGKWDTSPGYDDPNQPGFERAIRPDCVICHAGNWERIGESEHSLKFHEKAIGCESCHGAGARHKEFHLTQKRAPGEADPTIVHPGKLPRPLLESVCASCHLASSAVVTVRGRPLGGFRPGVPLSDFTIHYNVAQGSDKMTVVGHVEQLRQSACYQKSTKPELSCISCHDPHATAKPADPVAFYRQKCIDCHEKNPCTVPLPERLKQNAADNCAACHMPRADTEIQHVAFTHHRIGRHAKRPQPESAPEPVAPELVALDENPHLSVPDRKRNLGFAYKDARLTKGLARYAEEYARRAWENVYAAYQAGARDGETVFALADLLATEGDFASAVPFAREALAVPHLHNFSRAQCLHILAIEARENRDFPAAIGLMERVVRVRQLGSDWGTLGACFLDDRKPLLALPAFQRALAVRPYSPGARFGIADCYQQLGDDTRAKAEREKAQWLLRNKRF